MLIAGTLVEQQSPCELLPVELSEQVLVTDVGQQFHDLLQGLFNCLVRQFLTSTLWTNKIPICILHLNAH